MAESVSGLDPMILLLLALVLDAYLGDARFLFKFTGHPVEWMGLLIGFLDAKLNREKRSDVDRAIRGALVVVFVGGLAGGVGWAVAWVSLTNPWGWFIELFGIMALLAGRSLYDHVKAVAVGLEDNLEAGRRAVRHIVGRDPSTLDEHGVARGAIESAAENFCDGVVAPVFWYVLFGFPGLCVYKAVNTMDSMIGYRSERYRAFGMTAARLDDVLNIFPARLAGIFIVIASVFVPTASPKGAFAAMMRDAAKHGSMNAGWTEAPMAGALGLALAGPRKYGDTVVDGAWMGDGKARVTARDIRRALYLYAAANLVNAAFAASLTVVRIGMPT
ncbi:MAG: adenosylcobinamide-phosphate synthase CbiB [Magnetovibrio sp.]|nr:adenosylcobinamide-phosphate synthase CbiB [Magnetovibrio sp.]